MSRSSARDRSIHDRTVSRQTPSGFRQVGVGGHDAAGAIDHPGFVQDVGGAAAQLFEPAVRIVRRTVRIDQRIVLIHGEQALAAPARAEYEQGVGRRRLAQAVVRHFRLRKLAGPFGQRPQFAGDQGRDVSRVDLLEDQGAGNRGQLRPHPAEFETRSGGFDAFAECDGVAGPLAQQVAGAQRAAQHSVFPQHAEMADASARHFGNRPVDELIPVNRYQRALAEAADRRFQGRGSVAVDRAQDVAFGNDAAGPASGFRRQEQGTDLALHHRGEHRLYRPVVVGRQRRTLHQIADSVAVGVTVDADIFGDVRSAAGPARLVPPGPGFFRYPGRERADGPLCLRQGDDAPVAELRHDGAVHLRGGPGVAQRTMAVGDFDTQPAGRRVERPFRQGGGDQIDQMPDVERPRRLPRQAVALVLGFQHRQIETDGIADHHRGPRPCPEFGHPFGKRRRIGNIGIRDAVDFGGRLRDRDAGIDQLGIDALRPRCAGFEADRADFDDPDLLNVEASRFRIDRDGRHA